MRRSTPTVCPTSPAGARWSGRTPGREHRYVSNIEVREDGGTPGFLQAIRAALAITLKDLLGVERMLERERTQVRALLTGLSGLPGLHLLASHIDDRLGIASFYLDDLHYNLVVRLLSDRFGVQARGGCSCAGTYGHYLLHVGRQQSQAITSRIDQGDLSGKPGWVRLSIHPTTPDDEIAYIIEAVEAVAREGARWAAEYDYVAALNEFRPKSGVANDTVRHWFDLGSA